MVLVGHGTARLPQPHSLKRKLLTASASPTRRRSLPQVLNTTACMWEEVAHESLKLQSTIRERHAAGNVCLPLLIGMNHPPCQGPRHLLPLHCSCRACHPDRHCCHCCQGWRAGRAGRTPAGLFTIRQQEAFSFARRNARRALACCPWAALCKSLPPCSNHKTPPLPHSQHWPPGPCQPGAEPRPPPTVGAMHRVVIKRASSRVPKLNQATSDQLVWPRLPANPWQSTWSTRPPLRPTSVSVSKRSALRRCLRQMGQLAVPPAPPLFAMYS